MSKVALPQHGNAKYPWPKWENGSTYRAKLGKDFKGITAESFRRVLTTRALRRGMKAVTRVSGDVVTFRFEEKGGE